MKDIRIAAFLIFTACTILSCNNSSSVSNPTLPTTISSAEIPSSQSAAATTELSEDDWLSRQNPVVEIAWSQDSGMLTVSAISGVYVFDIKSEKIVYALEQSEFLSPFALDPQGRYLFTKDRVWDVWSGELLYQLPLTSLSAVVFSPDSKTLAISDNTSITLWDADTGKLKEALPLGLGDAQQGLAFSSDGHLLYAVSSDRNVNRIDLIMGEYVQLFSLPEDVCCVTFSPDSRLMLVSLPHYGEGSKQLWNVEPGKMLKDSGRCDSDVGLAAFSPDNQSFVIGPCGNDTQFWDVSTRQLLHSFSSEVLLNHDPEWRSAAFSPDGTSIALGNEMGEVLIWDVGSYQLVTKLSIPGSSLTE